MHEVNFEKATFFNFLQSVIEPESIIFTLFAYKLSIPVFLKEY